MFEFGLSRVNDFHFSASSLLSLESGGGGWSPPPSRDWRAAISTPLAYRQADQCIEIEKYFVRAI